MPLSFTIDTELRIVRITAEGESTVGEHATLSTEWTRHRDYRPEMPILIDNRLRTEPADKQHITEFVNVAEQASFLPKGTRCAIVVSTDVQFGMTRMFASLSDERPLVTVPFRDIRSAEEWLTGGDE